MIKPIYEHHDFIDVPGVQTGYCPNCKTNCTYLVGAKIATVKSERIDQDILICFCSKKCADEFLKNRDLIDDFVRDNTRNMYWPDEEEITDRIANLIDGIVRMIYNAMPVEARTAFYNNIVGYIYQYPRDSDLFVRAESIKEIIDSTLPEECPGCRKVPMDEGGHVDCPNPGFMDAVLEAIKESLNPKESKINLHERLKQALENEDFEEAAKIRDQIKRQCGG